MKHLYSKTVYGNEKLVGYYDNGIAKFPMFKVHFFEEAGTFGIDLDVYQQIKNKKDFSAIWLYIKEDVADVYKGQILKIDAMTFEAKQWTHSYRNFQPKVFCGLNWFERQEPKTAEEIEIEKLRAVGAI